MKRSARYRSIFVLDVCLLACVLPPPPRRARKFEPTEALRAE
jgi:hypothetical protein